MAPPSFLKRRGDFNQDGDSNKKAKTQGASGGLKGGFGAKMLSKMGWDGKSGLGSSQQGIAEPIQVKMRQAGTGIGQGEKTEQAKRHERAQAQRNGEPYESSEEEERAARKRRTKIKSDGKTSSGASTPLRSKQKFTIEDMTAAGMQVPTSLLEVLDARGSSQKLLSTSSIKLQEHVPAETAATKLARRGLEDLNAYATEFNDCLEQQKTAEYQEAALTRELADVDQEIATIQAEIAAAVDLQSAQDWTSAIDKLEQLRNAGISVDLSTAVAALHPHFKKIMAEWNPREDSLEDIASTLKQAIAVTASGPKPSTFVTSERARHKSTNALESMFWTYFLPKARAAIVNWQPYEENYALLSVFLTWEGIMPNFIKHTLLKQVSAKLSTMINEFSPRKSIKKKTTSSLAELLSPWVPLMPTEFSDPSTGLLSEAKRKCRAIFELWDLSRGIVPGIEQWRRVLGPELDTALVSKILPKMSSALSSMEIDPSDLDLTNLNEVLAWKDVLAGKWLAELIARALLPQIMEILHVWLTSDGVDYGEVGAFFQYFKSLTSPVNEFPIVAEQYDRCLDLINQALDLGDRAQSELPLPQTKFDSPAPASPLPPTGVINEPPSARKEVEETTFRDVVEAWCSQEDLLMIPLRKAHETTGSPLFRITASAAGQGGVLIYLKGDVLYAQSKNKSVWEPMGLGDELARRSEGK